MPQNSFNAAIVTLGCRVNQYESDVISQSLEELGFNIVPFGTPADVTIINTCTVTAESDRKSRQLIRRALSAAPSTKLIVTGCYAETGTEEILSIDGVTYISGNARKSALPEKALLLAKGAKGGVDIHDIFASSFDLMSLKSPKRTRSYIKIEDGCDNRCAYCIIPHARGKVRSKPRDVINEEARRILDGGCLEVILTGIETAAYGRDFAHEPYYGASLAAVICDMASLGFPRIRLGSLDPNVLNERFISAVRDIPALMPHFHLSVQSSSSSVLNRMRRPYNAEQLRRGIRRLRDALPDATLSADVIVGFPGETDEEFRETVDFAIEADFLHLHIFPYSKRAGTEAAEMDGQISDSVKAERLHSLESAHKEQKKMRLDDYVNAHKITPVYVMGEKCVEGEMRGHSEHFVEIRFRGDTSHVKKVCPVRLTHTDGEKGYGELDPGAVL